MGFKLGDRSGLDAKVQANVFNAESATETLALMCSRVRKGVIPDGSVIAFGCHGGRHRSVAMAERFRQLLEADGYDDSVGHLGLRPR